MANLRICPRNIFDASEGVILTASPVLATSNPLSYLQSTERSNTARSTSNAAQSIRASWAIAKAANFLFVKMHNLSTAAQLAVPIYSDSNRTTLIAANAAANCFAYTGLSDNDIVTEDDFSHLRNSVRYFTLSSVMKSMSMDFTDPNNPWGFMEWSRIFGGKYYEFEFQIPGGGNPITMGDSGTQESAEDNSVISDKGGKGRRLELAADSFTATDWPQLLSIARHAGMDRDVFVSVKPTLGTWDELYHHGLFKFQTQNAFDRKNSNQGSTRLVLVEA